jgi:pimeloyl-[acyl-carrier protein] methyl ester esterase
MNLLLLRGLVREKRYWGKAVKLLEEKGYNVLCLDLPGLGEHADMEFPWTVRQAYLKIRHEFLEKKQAGPYSVMSISLGGMIALEWAHQMPSDFERIIVINTSASNVGMPWERLLPKAMKQCLQITKEKDIAKREKIILEMTTNQAYKDALVLAEWAAIAKTSHYTIQTAIRQLAAASQFRAPEKLLIPCLVLASQNDGMVSVDCSVRLAKRLQAEIRIHPTAGHDISVDDPEWVVAQI